MRELLGDSVPQLEVHGLSSIAEVSSGASFP